MRRVIVGSLIALTLVAAVGAGGAVRAGVAPGRDVFRGAWVSDDGDGSTSRWLISAPGSDGVRHWTLFDTYATFCEGDAGAGSGSSLVAHGTAVDDGTVITVTVTSFHCANGDPGPEGLPLPFDISATYVDGRLDLGGGFFATRPGSG